jgi:UDP-glucose 4-epimerase
VRAIVTGGAGFIGSHIVDALVARGDDVTVLDNFASGRHENVNESAKLRERDIREPFQIDADVVFHFAAQADVRVSVERPGYDAAVNVLGTINVLEAARAAGARIVFGSTGGAVYGECEAPAGEDAPRQPLAPYGTSKLCGEEYLATYNRLYASRHVVLRLGNVYGPRQDPHGEAGVVAIFLSRLRDGRSPRIFGDGEQVRDYVYVGDVVRAALAAAERAGGVYNVGTGIATSVLELVSVCRSVSGSDVPHEHAAARQGELQRSVLDVSAAARDLDWRPGVGLEQGLRETWDWIAAR